MYLLVVADECLGLHRLDVLVHEVEPVPLVADLVHVDVPRRHVLVSSRQAVVLICIPLAPIC